MHITVCICTYCRPALLRRLLQELARQETGGLFSYGVVVADNDEAASAREVVEQAALDFPGSVTYCREPRRNIALARNKTIEYSQGDFIAFIDDDEFPGPSWLASLLKTCQETKADGVLGPVLPWFEKQPPSWITKGGFCDRPSHPTGFVMNWKGCRTGNVLLRRDMLVGIDEPFRAQFGTGSEDVDFFRRMTERGRTFVWCEEAAVHEVVPPNRLKRSFMLKRALLRGGNSIKHARGRWLNVAKALVALPLYALALPFLFLAGHHHFMKFMVKLCDHVGRLLALLGLNPVNQREM